jgi:hypothetical protein
MRENTHWVDSRMTNSRIPSQPIQSTLPVAWGHARPTPRADELQDRWGQPVLTGNPADHLIAAARGSR